MQTKALYAIVNKNNHFVPKKASISCARVPVCVHKHARRDESDLSGTGTSQRTTAGIQFSGGDGRTASL